MPGHMNVSADLYAISLAATSHVPSALYLSKQFRAETIRAIQVICLGSCWLNRSNQADKYRLSFRGLLFEITVREEAPGIPME